MPRRSANRKVRHELVPWKYAERTYRKGWMERDFNIGGKWFRWKKNVCSKDGILRLGVRDDSIELEMEKS